TNQDLPHDNGNVSSDTTRNLQSSYNLIILRTPIKSGDTVKSNYAYLSNGTLAAAYATASAGRDHSTSFNVYDFGARQYFDSKGDSSYNLVLPSIRFIY
ncbi:MAG: hypothetical protein IJS91_01990, partial [Bacteroidales bacterium]|nr:hypothetical protein [Bacteroidales bacterium]